MKIPLSNKDKLALFVRIDRLNPALDPSEVGWFWDTNMSLNNGNLGAYYGVLNEIRLPEDARLIIATQDEMLPSICHELWHAYQRKSMGLLIYKALAFRPWAGATVERGARTEARRVELLLGIQGQDTGEQVGD